MQNIPPGLIPGLKVDEMTTELIFTCQHTGEDKQKCGREKRYKYTEAVNIKKQISAALELIRLRGWKSWGAEVLCPEHQTKFEAKQ